MLAEPSLPYDQPFPHRWRTISQWGLHLFAMVTLAAQIVATLVFWPIPELGLQIDTVTGVIAGVDARSAGERAGLLPGDRVERIYSYGWREAERQLFLFPLAWESVRSIPIRIERADSLRDLRIPAERPSPEFQLEKIVALVIGVSCWLTGYLIGLVRRHESAGAPVVAWFWMAVGGIAGSYTFARYASYPLTAALQWTLVTTVAPLAALMHLWFPARPIDRRQSARMRNISILAILGSNLLGLVALLIWRPGLLALIDLLSYAMPAILALSLVATGLLLLRVYMCMPIAHVRRQVRVIAIANLLIAFCWIALRSVPALLNPDANVPHMWLDLLIALIPLAYLLGALSADLYRVDRVLIWLGGHALTILALLVLITAFVSAWGVRGPEVAVWMGVGFVALYQPARQLGSVLIPDRLRREHSYTALVQSATQLASTLDRPRLAAALCQGIEATFGEPPIGLYLREVTGSGELVRTVQRRLHLPELIAPGTLTGQLAKLPLICESRDLQRVLASQALAAPEQELVYQPGVVLWCPLRTGGDLHGLLLLGMRDDLDPYRPEHLRELQAFLQTAVLALANSATYLEQVEAEQTIRRLYKQLQHIQDETAAAIVRDIHDEVINVMVRLNIASLEKLLQEPAPPDVHAELELVLEGERATANLLRDVCERLNPTGIEEPTGLASSLRRQVVHIQRIWPGECRLEVEGVAQPVAAAVQREALRIMREAVTNAVKHANASEILVTLHYPTEGDPATYLAIWDDGTGQPVVRPKVGAWGIRSMYESAHAVGGTLAIRATASGGVEVVFTLPA